ncbi:hypothetical protein [Leucobacter allii]|uniref:hypothetical protein n=1 Tax=Leucobacter allii TaxID=2932247 RepID=UPI003D2A0067
MRAANRHGVPVWPVGQGRNLGCRHRPGTAPAARRSGSGDRWIPAPLRRACAAALSAVRVPGGARSRRSHSSPRRAARDRRARSRTPR